MIEVLIKKDTKVSSNNNILGGADLVKGAVMSFPEHVADSLVRNGIASLIDKTVEEDKPKPKRKPRTKKEG